MIWDVATDSVVVEAAVVTGPAKVTADVVLVSPLVVEISAVVQPVVLDAVEVVASVIVVVTTADEVPQDVVVVSVKGHGKVIVVKGAEDVLILSSVGKEFVAVVLLVAASM